MNLQNLKSITLGLKSTCQQKRHDALQGHEGLQPVGRFIPVCDNTGKFETIQCWGSIGFCWCVDSETGTEVAGTRVRGKPDCSKKPGRPPSIGHHRFFS